MLSDLCPLQVEVCGNEVPETMYSVASRNEAGEIRLMVVNDTPRPTSVAISIKNHSAIWTMNQASFWAEFSEEILTLPAHAFACVCSGETNL